MVTKTRTATRKFALLMAAVIAACDKPATTEPSYGGIERAEVGTQSVTTICQVAYPGGTWFMTPIPTTNTTCGITWSMYFPKGNMSSAEYGILWAGTQLTGDGRNPLFQVGSYGDIQNGPLQITFNNKIKNVTITMNYVSNPGHGIAAYDANNAKVDTATLDANGSVMLPALGIRKVVIYPVVTGTWNGNQVVDGVTHLMSFEPDSTCPPTTDSILDHPDFKARYDSLMKLSNVDDSITMNRREWGMLMHDDPSAPNGIRIDWPSVGGTAVCFVDFGLLAPYPADTRGTIHNHLWREKELNPCPGPSNPEASNKPFIPDVNGGAGDGDWDLPIGREHYVFTPDRIFKLTRSVPSGAARRNNPYRWKKGSDSCFSQYSPPQ